MSLHRNIVGTWRTTAKAWRNIGGVWKECAVYRNIGGIWKLVHSSAQIITSPNSPVVGDTSLQGNGAFVQVDVNATNSATWTFTLLTGSATGITTGSTSGFSTWIRLARSAGVAGSRSASYRVTDTISGLFIDVSIQNDWNDIP